MSQHAGGSTKSGEIWLKALKFISVEEAMNTMDLLENEKKSGNFNSMIQFPSDFIRLCKNQAVKINHAPHEKNNGALKETLVEIDEKFNIRNIVKKFVEKTKMNNFEHPVWDENLINPASKKFNKTISEDRKKYLVGLNNYDAESLSLNEKYERIRLLRQREASSMTKKFR